ncbi:MAG: PAS domain S-box protein [Desulfobacteraceae bacterium]|nr:PAS domain S-box protein [Desulfobacteraceae bacterium]
MNNDKKNNQIKALVKDIAELSADAIFITDQKGNYVYVNKSACDLLGYTADELTKLNISDIAHKDHVKEQQENFKKLLETGKTFTEINITRKTGEIITADLNAALLPNGLVYGSCRDITKRKLSEDILRKNTAMFAKMLANIGDVIVIIDKEGINRYKSPNVERLFGWKPEELVGKSTFENIHPEDIEYTQIFFRELFKNPNAKGSIECRYKCKNGSYNWIEFTGVNLFEDPDIKGILGNYHDITKKKKTEESLKESETRFKALHNASFGGITIHDKGIILDCNKGLSEITGYSKSELIGMDGLLLIAEKSRKTVMKNILSGYEKPYEAFGLRKNGEEYPVRLEARNIPYKGKQVRSVEFRDITDQKKAEKEQQRLQEQLNQAQKIESIGRLAGGIAHDFNNMLSIIIGNAEIALEEAEDQRPLRDFINEILKASERSADLTRQLLTFARKQTVSPMVLDLNKTIAGMLKMLTRLIGEDISLKFIPDKNIAPVKIDPSQVDQILANLCVNSRDSIKDIGSITIETSNIVIDESYCENTPEAVPGNYVIISVSDNGSGMSKKTVKKIFEPFFTTKKLGAGTGLGLATVYGIVKQNKGFINVYSELEKGTVFKIYLPGFSDSFDEIKPVSASNTSQKGSETVLVAEDEEGILNFTVLMLKKLGYKVIKACSGEDALKAAQSFSGRIDLIITDVIMPDMNGKKLSEEIKKIYPEIKTLFMSGYTANVIAHHGVLEKNINFINKPFTKSDLASKLREILNQ